MPQLRAAFACIFLTLTSIAVSSFAQGNALMPKYGPLPKNEVQRAADEEFLKAIDERHQGNRAKAAGELVARGWQYLRQGNNADAMRRFNQAWLLNTSSGSALWGMAAVLGSTGKTAESLKLFSEAERTVGGDIDFSVDYARTIGIAGAESKNDVLLKDAFSRFEQNYTKAPQHVLNLQNWAITLFYVEKYAEAWAKIRLAEAAPRRTELDANFIAALQARMPRP